MVNRCMYLVQYTPLDSKYSSFCPCVYLMYINNRYVLSKLLCPITKYTFHVVIRTYIQTYMKVRMS